VNESSGIFAAGSSSPVDSAEEMIRWTERDVTRMATYRSSCADDCSCCFSNIYQPVGASTETITWLLWNFCVLAACLKTFCLMS